MCDILPKSHKKSYNYNAMWQYSIILMLNIFGVAGGATTVVSMRGGAQAEKDLNVIIMEISAETYHLHKYRGIQTLYLQLSKRRKS